MQFARKAVSTTRVPNREIDPKPARKIRKAHGLDEAAQRFLVRKKLHGTELHANLPSAIACYRAGQRPDPVGAP
jgi:hypothetical protein